jgi:hypothetical protein
MIFLNHMFSQSIIRNYSVKSLIIMTRMYLITEIMNLAYMSGVVMIPIKQMSYNE